MNIRSHYNFKELAIEAIDLFNKRLDAVGAPYRLQHDTDKVSDYYNINVASKKTFLPKEDYPPLSYTSSVKEIRKVAFALCCFSTAFIKHGLVENLGSSQTEPAPVKSAEKQVEVNQ